jgi:hypothetical protein
MATRTLSHKTCEQPLNQISIRANWSRSQPIAEYRDAPIAVHASYYLQKFLDTPPSAEPLLSAIGGFPLAIRIHINADLDQWQKHGITPRFYFDGQATVGLEEVAMKDAKSSMEKSNAAWQPYYQNQPTEAVIAFGKTGMQFDTLGGCPRLNSV